LTVTTAEILATIDSELNWREAELALLKKQLVQDVIADDAIRFRLSYRAFAAITYAHYEGFVKMVLAEALESLRKSGIRPSECVDQVQLELFGRDIRRSLDQMSNVDLLGAISRGYRFIDSFSFPSEDKIWDISNLDVPTFNRLVSSFGLSPDAFSSFRRHIGRLVTLRHECAHGEILKLDATKTNRELAQELFEIQAQITLLLHAISLELVDYFENENFATPAYHRSKNYVP